MDKKMLISLWIAQGYVVEDVAEQYFLILMRRCFFQDVEEDRYGNIVSVKIHDLMHDVAQEVSKEEIFDVSGGEIISGAKVRHVNIISDGIANLSLCSRRIRSYISRNNISTCCLWENLTTLRVLDLSYSDFTSLPQMIDRLLLLRYLNLGHIRNLVIIPDSITRLYNLQTLVLGGCESLREVPEDFSGLINLRHLDLYGCDKLNKMPLGILKLSKLRVLPYFVARNEILDEELKVLQQVFTKIKGFMHIFTSWQGGKPLTCLKIENYRGRWVIHDDVFQKLELPPYLNELYVCNYKGTIIPRFTLSSPHNLLHIEIALCGNLQQIPVLSKLPLLKLLKLSRLSSVEYMENGMSCGSSDTNRVVELFRSLESLTIHVMNKLKGWWKVDISRMRLCFPRLSHLDIEDCPNWTSFALCSNQENLRELQIQLPSLRTVRIKKCRNLTSNFMCPPTLEKFLLLENKLHITGELGKMREMWIDKADHLKLLPPTNCLTSLTISGDIEVESAIEYVRSCSSSPLTLTIRDCKYMRRVPRLDHLIALEKLTLSCNYELTMCEEDDEVWKIYIEHCRKIKSLPEAIKNITTLKELWITSCPDLEKKDAKIPMERISQKSKTSLLLNFIMKGGGQVMSGDKVFWDSDHPLTALSFMGMSYRLPFLPIP